MCDQRARPDLKAAELAARQHGVVSAGQLYAIGFDKHRIHHRVRTGRWHRVHRGVYAVGHGALSDEAMCMAAILACGVVRERTGSVFDHWGAAISYRSAARLWDLLPAAEGPTDVSVFGYGGKRRRKGIRLHRSKTLLRADVTLRNGVPVTTPARTIADLRRASLSATRLISPRELRRAIRQADVLGLPLGNEIKGDRTRSDLERAFLRLCQRHHLSKPEVNVRVGPHLVDFLWRGRRLVVETDGYAYHRGRVAFEDDRDRDLDLRARGFEVLRLTEKQIDQDEERVAEVVAAGLRVGADVPGSP